jgi:hypothetical protein
VVTNEGKDSIWIPTPEELADLTSQDDSGRSARERRRRPARGQSGSVRRLHDSATTSRGDHGRDAPHMPRPLTFDKVRRAASAPTRADDRPGVIQSEGSRTGPTVMLDLRATDEARRAAEHAANAAAAARAPEKDQQRAEKTRKDAEQRREAARVVAAQSEAAEKPGDVSAAGRSPSWWERLKAFFRP